MTYVFEIPLARVRSPPFSRCVPMIITQEPTQPLAALHGPLATNVRISGKQQDIAFPLVIPLSMEMLDVFAQRSPQGAVGRKIPIRVIMRPDRRCDAAHPEPASQLCCRQFLRRAVSGGARGARWMIDRCGLQQLK